MDIEPLARMLAAAREQGVQARPGWPNPAPTLADAYAVQERANALFADDFVGWKCGATNPAARAGLGLDDSFIGPIPKRVVRGDGATIAFTETIAAIEPEIAFRLRSDLGAGATAETAKDAVDAAHLAIEVIGRCAVGPGFETGLGLTLDFAGNAWFVVGDAIEDWQAVDLTEVPVRVERDGAEVASGSTANVMGDPLASLAWAANRLAQDGRTLRAGEWVSTGTCTPAVPAAKGTSLVAAFGDLGRIGVRFD